MRVQHDQDGKSAVLWGPKETAVWVAAILASLGLGVTGFTGSQSSAEQATQACSDVQGSVREEFHELIDDTKKDIMTSIEKIHDITDKRRAQIDQNRRDLSLLQSGVAASSAKIESMRYDIRRIEALALEKLKYLSERPLGPIDLSE